MDMRIKSGFDIRQAIEMAKDPKDREILRDYLTDASKYKYEEETSEAIASVIDDLNSGYPPEQIMAEFRHHRSPYRGNPKRITPSEFKPGMVVASPNSLYAETVHSIRPSSSGHPIVSYLGRNGSTYDTLHDEGRTFYVLHDPADYEQPQQPEAEQKSLPSRFKRLQARRKATPYFPPDWRKLTEHTMRGDLSENPLTRPYGGTNEEIQQTYRDMLEGRYGEPDLDTANEIVQNPPRPGTDNQTAKHLPVSRFKRLQMKRKSAPSTDPADIAKQRVEVDRRGTRPVFHSTVHFYPTPDGGERHIVRHYMDGSEVGYTIHQTREQAVAYAENRASTPQHVHVDEESYGNVIPNPYPSQKAMSAFNTLQGGALVGARLPKSKSRFKALQMRRKAVEGRLRDTGESNYSEPWNHEVIRELANHPKDESDELDPLHDYLRDVAYQHYQDQNQAENYARLHANYIRAVPWNYSHGASVAKFNLGRNVVPASSLKPGQKIAVNITHSGLTMPDDIYEVHSVDPRAAGYSTPDESVARLTLRNLRSGDFHNFHTSLADIHPIALHNEQPQEGTKLLQMRRKAVVPPGHSSVHARGTSEVPRDTSSYATESGRPKFDLNQAMEMAKDPKSHGVLRDYLSDNYPRNVKLVSDHDRLPVIMTAIEGGGNPLPHLLRFQHRYTDNPPPPRVVRASDLKPGMFFEHPSSAKSPNINQVMSANPSGRLVEIQALPSHYANEPMYYRTTMVEPDEEFYLYHDPNETQQPQEGTKALDPGAVGNIPNDVVEQKPQPKQVVFRPQHEAPQPVQQVVQVAPPQPTVQTQVNPGAINQTQKVPTAPLLTMAPRARTPLLPHRLEQTPVQSQPIARPNLPIRSPRPSLPPVEVKQPEETKDTLGRNITEDQTSGRAALLHNEAKRTIESLNQVPLTMTLSNGQNFDFKAPATKRDLNKFVLAYNQLDDPSKLKVRGHLGLEGVTDVQVKDELFDLLRNQHNPERMGNRIRNSQQLTQFADRFANMKGFENYTTLHDNFTQVQQELDGVSREMESLLPSLSTSNPNRDEALSKFNELKQKQKQLREHSLGLDKQLEAGRQHLRETIKQDLRAKDPVPMRVDESSFAQNHSTYGKETANKAAQWLDGIVEHSILDSFGNKVDFPSFKYYIAQNQDGATDYRPHYEQSQGINMPPWGMSVESQIHEMGHAIENNVPGVVHAAREFLKHRIGNDTPVKYKDVMSDPDAYNDEEMGSKDNFDKLFTDPDDAYYAGKVYPNGVTEIISMGLEQLYKDPMLFAKRDPEYFAFIVGILNGETRHKEPPHA